ncbi:MAG: hypothetical protein M3463_03760 [Verrucomicrobiota bacterium]|nr:hypothetical protein [Verrucomicrobiota bacterium]
MLPTFAALAGTKSPADVDGVSILPTLLGKPAEQRRRDYHYWEAAPQQALRQGDWKAYRAAPDKPLELYDLARDVGETTNLATAQPDLAAKLERFMTTSRTDSPDFPLQKKSRKKP